MINALVLESARVRSGRFGGRQIVTGGKHMKHYVLLKLAPGVDVEAIQLRVKKTYEQLDMELDWLN